MSEQKSVSEKIFENQQEILARLKAIEQKLDSNSGKGKFYGYEGKLPESYEGPVATFKRASDEGANRFSLIVPVVLLEEESWFREDKEFILVPVRLKDGGVVLAAVKKDADRTKEFVSQGGETQGEMCVFINEYARVNGADGKPVRMRFIPPPVPDDPDFDAPF